MTPLSITGEHFRAALSSARTHRERTKLGLQSVEKIHVVGAGGTLTSAYEQLRNAAENTEEHLLLQNAIRRFFRQLFIARDRGALAKSGDELAVELTLAGYLANDSLPHPVVARVNQLAAAHGALHDGLRSRHVGGDVALGWILDELSVSVERELSEHTDDDVFLQFCYDYFQGTIEPQKAFTDGVPADYDLALFIAVHRALLKSNLATIRADLLRRYQLDLTDVGRFIQLAEHIDTVAGSQAVDRLFRSIDRQAAPQRIIRRQLQRGDNVADLLEEKSHFMTSFESQIKREYAHVGGRIKRAIVRSIIFLFITKVIIGLAIEVPYDLWIHDHVIWLPLIINLLFPPLYMALLSLTLVLPGPANTKALSDRIATVLYAGEATVTLSGSRGYAVKKSRAFSIAYAVSSLVLFGLIGWLLLSIGFSFLHLIIFFIFLSTASFLGFRLSKMVSELEVVTPNQNALTLTRDLLYLPFVTIGQWLSEKYARVNIVTLVLDMVIELPLKTVLRLVRQWAVFINAKKDEI